MLGRMSSTELTYWKAWWRIEPWGEYRADLRAGSVAAPLLNIQLARNADKYKASDWLMEFEKPKPQTPDEMKSALRSLAAAGRKKHGKKRKATRRRRR